MAFKPIALAFLYAFIVVAESLAQESTVDEQSSIEAPPAVAVDNVIYVQRDANRFLLYKAAADLGITGRWVVVSSKKDGEFSAAQIGQEPGDLISIGLTENGRSPGFTQGGIFLPVG